MNEVVRSILQRVRYYVERRGYSINPIDRSCWHDQLALLQDLNVSNVVDVGANVGLVAAKYCELFPAARIFCVEPIHELAEQIPLNCPSASIHSVALSDNDGAADFHVNVSKDTSSLLESDLRSIPKSYAVIQNEVEVRKVATNRLDTLARDLNIEHIGVLKLDIQGGELAALEGASSFLRKANIDLIYTEVFFQPFYVNQPLFNDIFSRLAKDYYSLHSIYNCVFSGRTGKLQFADAIFVAPHLAQKSKMMLREDVLGHSY